MRSLSNFGGKIIFMCSVNFWHQQDSNASFKGRIGHVTSQCNWPIPFFVFVFENVIAVRCMVILYNLKDKVF